MQLVPDKKKSKKLSEFQKLWAKAERLKHENARFRQRMDEIIGRIQTEVRAAEAEAAFCTSPLLQRLLVLGQRKSLTQWQRRELDEWIQELLYPLIQHNLIDDELKEALARYDAFRFGIELDHDAPVSFSEQVRQHIEKEEQVARQESENIEELLREQLKRDVESILDRNLGPEPPHPSSASETDGGWFQDELMEEMERRYNEYHSKRDAAREALWEEMLRENSNPFGFDDMDFDPFGDQDPPASHTEDNTPAVGNAVFTRLFRATAARLHPDREPDQDRRKQKQGLMSRLLKARKQGDVMAVVELYQQHVAADDDVLSKTDEKQLVGALKRQIEELKAEKENYCFESPLHSLAYEHFYRSSRKKTDLAIHRHIESVMESARQAEQLASHITSLSKLKPYLEERYDANRFGSMMDAFLDLPR